MDVVMNQPSPADASQPLARHQEIMLGRQDEQRSAARFFNTAPVVIHADGARHVGLVRDLSGNGIFIYSDFKPAPGSTVDLILWLSKDVSNDTLNCRGKVVRVVATSSGAAVGIGLELDTSEVELTIPMPTTV